MGEDPDSVSWKLEVCVYVMVKYLLKLSDTLL